MPANTSPDGIVYPISTDPIAPLNTHFQDLAESVQGAIVAERTSTDGRLDDIEATRQNYDYRWANAAARAAQTGMRAGDRGLQVDTLAAYQYSGSAWVFSGFLDTGSVTVSSFSNSWASSTAAYSRKAGRVQLDGALAGGSSGVAFILPVGFRPPVIIQFVVQGVNSPTTTTPTIIQVNTNGEVSAVSGSQPRLGQVSFFATQ